MKMPPNAPDISKRTSLIAGPLPDNICILSSVTAIKSGRVIMFHIL